MKTIWRLNLSLLFVLMTLCRTFAQSGQEVSYTVTDPVPLLADTVRSAIDTVPPATDTGPPAADTLHSAEDTITPVTDTVPPAADPVPLIADTIQLEKGIVLPVSDTIPLMTDTVPLVPGIFTAASASEYITDLLGKENLWRSSRDTFRLSLERLIDHYNEPFDSVERRLSGFNYDSIILKYVYIALNDTLPLRWLNDSTFIVDTLFLDYNPFIIQRTFIRKYVHASTHDVEDRVPDRQSLIDTMVQVTDTITRIIIDSALLESRNIQIHRIVNGQIIPPLISPGSRQSARFSRDSGRIIITEIARVIMADRGSPFFIVPGEKMPDSLRLAVETLLSYTDKRDSILVFIGDIQGKKTPMWLTTGDDELYRYWIRNYINDSITIWMGNPAKHDITMILEEDINLERLKKEAADDIYFIRKEPDKSLARVDPFREIPVFWQYEISNSFALNQNFLSNWSKGGENSLISLFDIKGTAEYNNTAAKTQWTNSGRLKYGAIITEEHGLRTNTDMLELNSQYNKVIKNKIDFSAVFYLKSQIAKGYNYPNDSVVVSKFLNPGTFTIGLGLEYKPFKNTALNFSMLSYKNTFVLDTAHIDQTAHGIDIDKRANQEIGGQLFIKNKVSILEDMNISNSVRLFSNYLDKPENIDMDWEIALDKRITWYFSILLSLHMIYDDDIRFPVLDEDDQPILLPDGSKKKVPRMQFKELLGLSFSFRF